MRRYNNFGININNEEMLILKKDNLDNFSYIMFILRKLVTNLELINDIHIDIEEIDSIFKKLKINDDNIIFAKATDIIKIDDLEKDIIDYQEHQCHLLCMKYLWFIKGTIVTGYTNYNKYKIIHSWIEKDNLVYDLSFNLIMEKDVFYKLLSVDVIDKFNLDDFENFYSLKEIMPSFSLKLVLMFPKELQKEFASKKYLKR